MKNRYYEIKKENNLLVTSLSGNYQILAKKIIKLCRKVGVNNVDTEVIIKNSLLILKDYEERLVEYNIVIPNEDIYLDSITKDISKKVPNKYLPKEIIASAIFCLCFIGFFVLIGWLKSDNYFATPTNIEVTKSDETSMKITWDEMYYTDNGYTVYYIGEDNIKSYEQVVKTNECYFTITISQKYDIYIKVNETDLIKESNWKKVSYDFK